VGSSITTSERRDHAWRSTRRLGSLLGHYGLTATFSRLLELRASDPGPFNYPIAVFPEWRGKVFYLCARFRTRSRRPEDDFVVRHARMTLTGFGRFDLAYFRHTDRWFTVDRGLTATDCFQEIEGNEIFWPTT
jgi:hypothetical protein